MNTTAQLETAIAMVEKRHGLGNQQPSPCQMGKVQRLERKLVGSSDPKRGTPRGDDIVCPIGKPMAAKADDTQRVSLNSRNDVLPCRLDILYGYTAMRPQLACRLVAN